jgi:hypothetical protein
MDKPTWRTKRMSDLAACDWTQVADVPLDPAKRQEWGVYRQALRDIGQTFPNAVYWDDVTWPVSPE